MIISKARKVRVADPAAFAWAGLRKFQNADLVTKLLIELHNVPKKYHDDVRKQAQQIRYCLVQAREYFAAANSVTTATKPNLLYYGTMSLALAEILFKQSGASSLDKARDENRHHGLVCLREQYQKIPTWRLLQGCCEPSLMSHSANGAVRLIFGIHQFGNIRCADSLLPIPKTAVRRSRTVSF